MHQSNVCFCSQGVGSILAYDHDKDATRIQQEVKKLSLDCEAASDEIKDEIDQRKELFDKKVFHWC